MERVGWIKMGWINFLVTSDEAPHGRPHPDMIFDMMRLAGIEDAGEVTKVGDTEVDIREGQNAGCRYVIGVTTGAFSRPELEKYQPTHIRSEERRVGKEGVSTCRSRWSPDH